MDREDETRDQLTRPTYSYHYYGSSHLQQFPGPFYDCGVTGQVVSQIPKTVLINSDSDNEDCVEIQVCSYFCARLLTVDGYKSDESG